MKRRTKAVLAGFALVLVAFSAAAVFFWKEAPPYRFMKGGKLWYVEKQDLPALSPSGGPAPSIYRLHYSLGVGKTEVWRSAWKELRGSEWGGREPGVMLAAPNGDYVYIAAAGDGKMRIGGKIPTVPDGGRTLVIVHENSPSGVTRFRGWLHSLSAWRGKRP